MTASRHKVLIIDDDDTVCKVLSLTLKRSGMTVLTSTSPKEGLALVRREPLDIVISDVRMPEMSGVELLRTLRAEGIVTPFLIISSQSSKDILLQSLQLGAFDLINKPMQASIIGRLMDEAIRVSQRQKHIALMRAPGTEVSTLDQALAWTLANVSPLAAFDSGRLDQKTLDALAIKDPQERLVRAAQLALQTSRPALDNLRNFADRTWDLGVLIRVYNGLRASFEAGGEPRLTPALQALEACYAWLRVRPEDLASDLAVTLALVGDHLGHVLKAMKEGGDVDAAMRLFDAQLATFNARVGKTYRAAS
jgi:DNA-binding response OmpR family regulator